MCHRAHCGEEGPVLVSSLAMLARDRACCAWLRVAPRLPSPCIARRGWGVAQVGTGKQVCQSLAKKGTKWLDKESPIQVPA
jgi:hypothetical protein